MDKDLKEKLEDLSLDAEDSLYVTSPERNRWEDVNLRLENFMIEAEEKGLKLSEYKWFCSMKQMIELYMDLA